MKKFLLTMLGVLLALPALAHDFTYEYEGQTLTYIVLDEDAKTVYVAAFNNVSGELLLPSHPNDGNMEYTLTSIGYYAFYGCSTVTSVEIPNSVTSIGDYAFYQCSSLTSVGIPTSVTSIGMNAFNGCNTLTSVEIPNSVTSIENGTFCYCSSLISVEIPNSVTSIGDYAFDGCGSLTSVVIPNSVTSIGDQAFYECSSLTSVEIPNSVTSIGGYAFKGCGSLISVYYNTTAPVEAANSIFSDGTYSDATLYVPESAVETFKQTEPWSNFQNIQGYTFSTGMEDVTTGFDETLPCEYFNLSGVKAGTTKENLAPGIYIMRQGSATKKIVVK